MFQAIEIKLERHDHEDKKHFFSCRYFPFGSCLLITFVTFNKRQFRKTAQNKEKNGI